MRAILTDRKGFQKEFQVQDPPPPVHYVAEMEGSSLTYQQPDSSDLHLNQMAMFTRRTFRRVRIDDPEREYQLAKGPHAWTSVSSDIIREEIFKRHLQKYKSYDPVAIYEEEPEQRISSAERKALLDKAYEIAKKEGLLGEDIPVEPDNIRLIELDNEFQDV